MPKPGSWILPAFATAWSPMPLPLGMWLLAGPLKVVQGGLWTCFWRGSGSWQRVFRYYSSSSGTTAVPQGFRFLRYYISSSGIQVPQVLYQFLRDSGSSGTTAVPQGFRFLRYYFSSSGIDACCACGAVLLGLGEAASNRTNLAGHACPVHRPTTSWHIPATTSWHIPTTTSWHYGVRS